MATRDMKSIAVKTIPYVIIAALSVEIMFLIQQNMRLRTQLDSLTTQNDFGRLIPGDTVQTLSVRTIVGKDSAVSYGDPAKKSLLFVLSPACPYCKENLSLWSLIKANSDASTSNVFGISIFPLEPTKSFIETNSMNFDVVIGADSMFQRSYKVNNVPMTILVRNGGVVENVWIGKLSAAQVDSIISAVNTPIAAPSS